MPRVSGALLAIALALLAIHAHGIPFSKKSRSTKLKMHKLKRTARQELAVMAEQDPDFADLLDEYNQKQSRRFKGGHPSIVHNYMDAQYFVDIGLGSPPQTFKASPDLFPCDNGPLPLWCCGECCSSFRV